MTKSADMIKTMDDGEMVSVSRKVAAPIDVVWQMVSDLSRMGDWSPENDGGSWRGADPTWPGGPSVGSVFRGDNHRGRRTWKTKVTVIDSDPPRRFAFRLKIGALGGCDWIYDIEPTDAGCCVTESWIDERTRALKFVGWLFTGVSDRASHNRANMEATLEHLAMAAEGVSRID